MYKKLFLGCLVSMIVFSGASFVFAQDWSAEQDSETEAQIIVKGVIVEIAEDGSYIVVNDKNEKVKFITTKEYVDDAYLEINDKITAYGEKTSTGLNLTDYDYGYNESSSEETEDEDYSEDISFDDYGIDDSDQEDSSQE